MHDTPMNDMKGSTQYNMLETTSDCKLVHTQKNTNKIQYIAMTNKAENGASIKVPKNAATNWMQSR